MSWKFFLAEWTFLQVIPTFRVPRVAPLEISCLEVIVDDLAYVLGSSKGFMTKDTDYST